jgi:hypothetical protein
MKKLFLFFCVIISFPLFAQTNNFGGNNHQYPLPGQGTFTGGFGLNWIDGKLYYGIHLTPEVSFANWGVGLDLRLDFDQQGNFRKENYNEFSDYLSIIRYIRYGLKNDPVYVKVGALDYYTLGHGSIINYYNNSPSLDSRRIGMVADIDYGKFGFESIYSNFFQAGLVGIRGYYRPFEFTPQADIPFIGKLELGATFASDFNDKAGIISGRYDKISRKFVSTVDDGSISIIGLDFGFPILNAGLFDVSFYTDYSKIIDFGSGIASGFKIDINALGSIRGYAKFERRFTFGKYLPSYFNSLYEIKRFQVDTANGTFSSKAATLASLTDRGNGYAMELGLNVVGLFYVSGNYERLDKDSNSGILHISSEINPESGFFIARAGYDKINIHGEGDIFKLDDRSYLYAEIGYKPVPYMIVSLVYNWTFAPVRDSDNNIVDYRPQKRVEPRVSLVIPMQF